jgi:glycosyl transferase family 25
MINNIEIDAILYINLAHRTDRNEHISNEIHKICNDNSKIHRIDAIKNNNGALGCSLSHIKAVEYALSHPEWDIVLILEDDFTFKSNNSDEIINNINKLIKNNLNIDVALLSHNVLSYSNTNYELIKKVLYSQTASSYIVKKHYLPTLLQNFKESTTDMEKNGKCHENCIDIYWNKLQSKDNWYTIYPSIGLQYNNYSDIENRMVDYRC